MIIVAYPGTGKTYLSKEKPEIIDLDIGLFNDNEVINFKIYRQVLVHLYYQEKTIVTYTNRDFFNKFIHEGKDKIVVVTPDFSLKEEYLERFRKRGFTDWFMNWQETGFTSEVHFLREIKAKQYILQSGEYLSDIYDQIIKEGVDE